MNYLGNDRNLVRDATLTATNILASQAIFRTDATAKTGGGRVVLDGAYTGQADAEIEVEVIDTASGTPRVSQPVFTGIGNGTLTDISVAGLAAQEIVLTLEDLGTETRAAYAPFQGVTLRARAAGSAGNAITVAVDHAALIATPSDFALQADLRQGLNEYLGEEWNFSAATLNPDGTLPDETPRLRFGDDPQVYRAYRFYRGGQYVYAFSPAPLRDVRKGARVHRIEGTRTIRIRSGAATETLGGIVTLYDALAAIRARSALILVDGVIVNDKLPGGQGAVDLSVWTQSYAIGVLRDGGDALLQADLGLAVAEDAPTEALTVRCSDNGGRWQVRGEVSGRLADAATGQPYAGGPYRFTIPLPVIDPAASQGRIVVEYQPAPRNGEAQRLPALCPVLPRLGAAARNGRWSFVYARRPASDCDCGSGELDGAPHSDCLGLEPGGEAMSDAQYLRRLQRLTTAVRGMVGDNTFPVQSVDPADVDWIRKTAAIFADVLKQLPAGTLALSAWQPDTAYAADDMREPAVANGYRYAVKTRGTSAATPPAWPTDVGTTVTDGSVVWECVGPTPWGMWDDAFDQWRAEAAALTGVQGAADITNDRSFEWRPTYWPPAGLGWIRPTAAKRNGCLYSTLSVATTPPYTGATEPDWPVTPGTPIVSGDFTFVLYRHYWTGGRSYTKGETIKPGDQHAWVVFTAGTSGASEPDWWGSASEVVYDGTVVWQRVNNVGVVPPVTEQFFERYRSMAIDVLAAAGIASGNFDQASVKGDGCWQDFADNAFWWVFEGDEPYLPIQTGHYYHVALLSHDHEGKPIATATREFGFGPKFGCPDLLQSGDHIVVTISGINGEGRGYQQGDTLTIQTTRAAPVPFGGGQLGNDTLTWSVLGSVAGRLADYALVTTAPPPYADGGLSLRMLPGGIRYALGDRYRFAIEGGRWRWRRAGGDWSAPADIDADTPLADGLIARFIAGAAPSWAAGDRWRFRAEAIHGVNGLRQPTDARCGWSGSTVIEIQPALPGAATGLLIADHTIPSTATLRLQGSDDDFASTPLDVPVPWAATHIWLPLAAATHARHRLIIDTSGSIQWLWLGDPLQLTIRGGLAEVGKLTKRWRIAGLTARQALGATIAHHALEQPAVDALLALLAHACTHDERRLGIVPNRAEAEVGLVRFAEESLELNDELDFGPHDPRARLIGATLTLEPAP